MGTTTSGPAGPISDAGVSAASLVDDHASSAEPDLPPAAGVDRSARRQGIKYIGDLATFSFFWMLGLRHNDGAIAGLDRRARLSAAKAARGALTPDFSGDAGAWTPLPGTWKSIAGIAATTQPMAAQASVCQKIRTRTVSTTAPRVQNGSNSRRSRLNSSWGHGRLIMAGAGLQTALLLVRHNSIAQLIAAQLIAMRVLLLIVGISHVLPYHVPTAVDQPPSDALKVDS